MQFFLNPFNNINCPRITRCLISICFFRFRVNHGTAKRLLLNRRYIGDFGYPPIIDLEIFNKGKEQLMERADKLNRINRELEKPKREIPTNFTIEKENINESSPFSNAIRRYENIVERS